MYERYDLEEILKEIEEEEMAAQGIEAGRVSQSDIQKILTEHIHGEDGFETD